MAHPWQLGQEGGAPQLERVRVVLTKGELVHHLQTCRPSLRPEHRGRWQTTARKDVLLDEVGRVDVALVELVGNHDALNAGVAAGLEQACHGAEISWPVFAAHGFDHLDRADRVKGLVGRLVDADVAVVLQPQVLRHRSARLASWRHAGPRHARLRPLQLLGAQRHADQRGAELGGGHLGQRTPAAADLQHALAGLDLHHAQCAPHLGVLRFLHRGLWRFKQGRRVVHGAVQPELVEGVAQVVVGVYVFLAVGFGVAVEQVLEPVGQAAQPGAVDDVFDFLAVDDQEAQQIGQLRRAPVTGNVAFGKADVARAQRCAANVPVVQVQAGHGFCTRAEALDAAAWQLQRERAVFEAGQQLEGAAGSGRRAGGQGHRRGRRGGRLRRVHRVTKSAGGLGLEMKGTCLRQSLKACQWMRASTPKVMAG